MVGLPGPCQAQSRKSLLLMLPGSWGLAQVAPTFRDLPQPDISSDYMIVIPLHPKPCPHQKCNHIGKDAQGHTKEKSIKTTTRYHLMPVRMIITNKPTHSKCWRGCGAKGTLVHRGWERRLAQPLWETVRRHLKESKMELPMTQRFHCGNLSEGTQNTNLKEYTHPYIHSSIIHNSQNFEAAPVPLSR